MFHHLKAILQDWLSIMICGSGLSYTYDQNKGEMQNALVMDTSRKTLPVTRMTNVFGIARLYKVKLYKDLRLQAQWQIHYKAKCQGWQLSHNKPTQCCRLGKEQLESCPAENGLGTFLTAAKHKQAKGPGGQKGQWTCSLYKNSVASRPKAMITSLY